MENDRQKSPIDAFDRAMGILGPEIISEVALENALQQYLTDRQSELAHQDQEEQIDAANTLQKESPAADITTQTSSTTHSPLDAYAAAACTERRQGALYSVLELANKQQGEVHVRDVALVDNNALTPFSDEILFRCQRGRVTILVAEGMKVCLCLANMNRTIGSGETVSLFIESLRTATISCIEGRRGQILVTIDR